MRSLLLLGIRLDNTKKFQEFYSTEILTSDQLENQIQQKNVIEIRDPMRS